MYIRAYAVASLCAGRPSGPTAAQISPSVRPVPCRAEWIELPEMSRWRRLSGGAAPEPRDVGLCERWDAGEHHGKPICDDPGTVFLTTAQVTGEPGQPLEWSPATRASKPGQGCCFRLGGHHQGRRRAAQSTGREPARWSLDRLWGLHRLRRRHHQTREHAGAEPRM